MERRLLGEVAGVFLRLGATAFGGPAAHVALMRRELVDRRGWETEQTFVDLVGLTSLLPGPNSTELAIELGRRRAGRLGLVVAGAAFIVPAALIVGVIAWAYERYGARPAVVDLRDGLLPVVVAIVAHATWKLGRTAVTGPLTAVLAVGAAVLFLLDGSELLLLAVGGLVAFVVHHVRRPPPLAAWPLLLLGGPSTSEGAGASVGELGLAELWWSFLRIGATLFGSGYVLVAFLDAEYVQRLGVLTPQHLVDAVAVGQVTPGPVFTTATFVGYLTSGVGGAVVASIAIFLPAFLLVAALGSLIERQLRRPAVRATLDGINAAAVGLIAGVTVTLVDDGIESVVAVAMAVVALAVLLRTTLNPTWLVVAGAILGLTGIV